MKRSLGLMLIVLVVALAAYIAGCSSTVVKSVQSSFVGAEKHEITLTEAVKYIQAYRKASPASAIKGGSFQRAILDKILAQPGCDGIRCYYAHNDDGSPTLVLVGITADGSDMTKGAIAEKITPCPPWCDESSELK